MPNIGSRIGSLLLKCIKICRIICSKKPIYGQQIWKTSFIFSKLFEKKTDIQNLYSIYKLNNLYKLITKTLYEKNFFMEFCEQIIIFLKINLLLKLITQTLILYSTLFLIFNNSKSLSQNSITVTIQPCSLVPSIIYYTVKTLQT